MLSKINFPIINNHTFNHHMQHNQPYDFIMLNNKQNSIVMLKQIKDMLPLFTIKPIFLLLNCTDIEPQLSTITNLSFLSFTCIDLMQKRIQSQLKGQYIELLAPTNMAEQIGDKLGHLQEIKHINFYEADDYDLQQFFNTLHLFPKRKHVSLKFGNIGFEEVAQSWRKKMNVFKIKKNTLPNVIFLNKDGWKSSIQLRTMIAMINQEQTNTHQIMDRFYKLFAQVYGPPPPRFSPYTGISAIIREYTKNNTPENCLTNNLLRASKDPSQIYYIQPYFRLLYKSIKSLYQQQKSTELICFRGASASQNEIKEYKNNVGQIVQNLGFLSTSKDLSKAQSFAKNLIIIITVKQGERCQKLDQGYANIESFSEYPKQKQVLFNPLNTFKIERVEKYIIKCPHKIEDDKFIEAVYLQYGALAEIRSRCQAGNQLSIEEQNYASQASYFVQNISHKIKNQGDAFVSYNDYISGGIEYWKEQLKHTTDEIIRGEILYKIGISKNYKGEYQESLIHYQESLQIKKHFLGSDHPECASILNNIGITYGNLGNYQQAIKYGQQCLKIQQIFYGNQHCEYAFSLNNIGHVYDKIADYKQSLKCYLLALQILAANNHLDVAATLNNIGLVYHHMGKYKEAIQYYQRCLKMIENTLGKSHPLYATTLNNIGVSLNSMGIYGEALKYYELCLIINQGLFGRNHPEFAIFLHNISNTYNNLGRYEEAIEKLQQCLKIQENILTKEHPDYACTLSTIGSTYHNMKHYIKAIQSYTQCLLIRKSVYGIHHPDYAVALNNIGNTLIELGEYDSGFRYFQQCLNIQRDIIGTDHSDYATTLGNIARFFDRIGKHEEAINRYEETLQIVQRTIGRNHQKYALFLNNLASTQYQTGNIEEALINFRQSLVISQERLGKDHSQCATISQNIRLLAMAYQSILELYACIIDIFEDN